MEQMKQNYDDLKTALKLENLGEAKNTFSTLQSEKLTKPVGYCEPEELARIILEESTDAIEPFGTLEEMIEYIRKAMAVNYVPTAELVP